PGPRTGARGAGRHRRRPGLDGTAGARARAGRRLWRLCGRRRGGGRARQLAPGCLRACGRGRPLPGSQARAAAAGTGSRAKRGWAAVALPAAVRGDAAAPALSPALALAAPVSGALLQYPLTAWRTTG